MAYITNKARETNTITFRYYSKGRYKVVAELKKSLRIDLHPDYLILARPLKEIGSFEIPVVVGKNRATFSVVVKAGEQK